MHLARAGAWTDAFVDVERRADGVHVLRASGLKGITLDRGALGATGEAPIVVEPGVPALDVRWESAAPASSR
jgi:hypothetical protein